MSKPKSDGPPDFSGFHTDPLEFTDEEHVVYDRAGRVVATVPFRHLSQEEAYRLAVAITAMGDLLDALRLIDQQLGSFQPEGHWDYKEVTIGVSVANAVRAAIRKATTPTEG